MTPRGGGGRVWQVELSGNEAFAQHGAEQLMISEALG